MGMRKVSIPCLGYRHHHRPRQLASTKLLYGATHLPELWMFSELCDLIEHSLLLVHPARLGACSPGT